MRHLTRPVPGPDLQRHQDTERAGRHPDLPARRLAGMTTDHLPRASRHDDSGRGDEGREHHVDIARRETRIEDHRHEISRIEISGLGVDRIADRRLHPAIGRQDPECRNRRANRHNRCREEVKLVAHPLPAEQHHTEEGRLEEEGGQDLITKQRSDHAAGLVSEDRPVGAKLV